MPVTMNSWLKVTMRPRTAAGAISAMYIGAATNTAPTPSPLSRRARINAGKLGAAAATAADTANTIAAARKTVRRPKRSASGPATTIASVAVSVCDVTAHPISKLESANFDSMKITAPVNSDPSKPTRKPESATISIVLIARGGFMEPG
jgi:hypothetical protein